MTFKRVSQVRGVADETSSIIFIVTSDVFNTEIMKPNCQCRTALKFNEKFIRRLNMKIFLEKPEGPPWEETET